MDLLHGFDDAQEITFFDDTADLDQWRRLRAGGTVEGADHRRLDNLAIGKIIVIRSGFCARWRSGRRYCFAAPRFLGNGGCVLDDADLLFAFGDFEFGDAGFLDEVDEFLEFA